MAVHAHPPKSLLDPSDASRSQEHGKRAVVSERWQVAEELFSSLADVALLNGFEAGRNRGHLPGFVVGIDACRWIDHALLASREPHARLWDVFQQLLELFQAPVIPVFVFDRSRQPVADIGGFTSMDTSWLRSAVQQFVRALGFRSLEVPAAVTKQLSRMNQEDIIDAVITGSADVWQYGAHTVICSERLDEVPLRLYPLTQDCRARTRATAGLSATRLARPLLRQPCMDTLMSTIVCQFGALAPSLVSRVLQSRIWSGACMRQLWGAAQANAVGTETSRRYADSLLADAPLHLRVGGHRHTPEGRVHYGVLYHPTCYTRSCLAGLRRLQRPLCSTSIPPSPLPIDEVRQQIRLAAKAEDGDHEADLPASIFERACPLAVAQYAVEYACHVDKSFSPVYIA